MDALEAALTTNASVQSNHVAYKNMQRDHSNNDETLKMQNEDAYSMRILGHLLPVTPTK